MHSLRRYLPSGVTWNEIQDHCYRAVGDLEMISKLADKKADISLSDVSKMLADKFTHRQVELALMALVAKQRVYSRYGLAGLRIDKTESRTQAAKKKVLEETPPPRRNRLYVFSRGY